MRDTHSYTYTYSYSYSNSATHSHAPRHSRTKGSPYSAPEALSWGEATSAEADSAWECYASPYRFLEFADTHHCPIQKSSGTLILSVRNEYTDFTNPGRALLSNHGAEHHRY